MFEEVFENFAYRLCAIKHYKIFALLDLSSQKLSHTEKFYLIKYNLQPVELLHRLLETFAFVVSTTLCGGILPTLRNQSSTASFCRAFGI